jgi:hypothetical protein
MTETVEQIKSALVEALGPGLAHRALTGEPPPDATRTYVKPNVLLNAAKPPGISPALMMHRPSLRVIFRLANRKPE